MEPHSVHEGAGDASRSSTGHTLGGGRWEVSRKPEPMGSHTHTHTHTNTDAQDCYPALREHN